MKLKFKNLIDPEKSDLDFINYISQDPKLKDMYPTIQAQRSENFERDLLRAIRRLYMMANEALSKNKVRQATNYLNLIEEYVKRYEPKSREIPYWIGLVSVQRNRIDQKTDQALETLKDLQEKFEREDYNSDLENIHLKNLHMMAQMALQNQDRKLAKEVYSEAFLKSISLLEQKQSLDLAELSEMLKEYTETGEPNLKIDEFKPIYPLMERVKEEIRNENGSSEYRNTLTRNLMILFQSFMLDGMESQDEDFLNFYAEWIPVLLMNLELEEKLQSNMLISMTKYFSAINRKDLVIRSLKSFIPDSFEDLDENRISNFSENSFVFYSAGPLIMLLEEAGEHEEAAKYLKILQKVEEALYKKEPTPQIKGFILDGRKQLLQQLEKLDSPLKPVVKDSITQLMEI